MKKIKFIHCLVLTFLICILVSTYWFQFGLIQGNSMIPTYHSFQLIVINKQSHSLQNGDVITFHSKTLNTYLTKRIVACPGDTLEIKNGILYVNDSPSLVTSVSNPINYAGIAHTPITLSSDEYFVLGDNYEDSKDSRYPEIGCISKEDILGTIFPQIPINQ